MVLHEEHHRPVERKRLTRLSRHYYDLACLIRGGVADQALADLALFGRVLAHRRVYFRYAWMDYASGSRGHSGCCPRMPSVAPGLRTTRRCRKRCSFGRRRLSMRY
ncbi:MAG: nucleotidyl transferase AbiEii/AbiGii toxin family protein [Burkholderiales bacterium]|nr:nucleotidyl transferase AbiEii/AbiGii toxin family protein [Burkholderiales bacterium]